MDNFEAEMVRRFVVAVEKIANALDHKTEQSICDGCKFYDGEDCYSQEPCKHKTEQTHRSTAVFITGTQIGEAKPMPNSITTWASTNAPQTEVREVCDRDGNCSECWKELHCRAKDTPQTDDKDINVLNKSQADCP